jgi:hypothetical protein
MNIQMIQMDRNEAAERLAAYRTSLRRSADDEYAAAVAGYETLAAGTPIVHVTDVIRQAPRDAQGRPLIAIARADRRHLAFSWHGHQACFDTRARSDRVPNESLLFLRIRMGDWPGESRWLQGYALVPMVPPHAVAAARGRTNLREHIVMWEVERWADRPIQAQPDRDPLLLRRVHGDLFAVVAQWDLTELERMIMTTRRAS